MFCYQQNFFTPTKEVTREQFWALVEAPYTRECITKFRETGDAAWKKRLPAFIFQATFDETVSKSGRTGHWRKQAATRLNGLCVLDVDHLGSEELRVKSEEFAADGFRQRAADLGILLVYITPSGHGLKVVFKADAAKGNLIDNMNALAKVLGVEADQSCKDASRMSFICTKEDILFINENELFTYEDKVFAKRFNEEYRRGDSKPTMQTPPDLPCLGEGLDSPPKQGEVEGVLSYGGWSGTLGELLSAYYGDQQPGPEEQGGNGMSRHTESLKWATDLLVMTGRNKQRVERLLRSIPWVDAIVKERGEPVDQTVKDADERVREREKKYGAGIKPSKAMQEALANLTKDEEKQEEGESSKKPKLPLEDWGREIEAMFGTFPCLREACQGLPVGGYPAALFTSAAFFGTLMTRCTWHHWFEPDLVRRLNYSIMIIGDPASGKSFANRLYKLIAAPIKAADKVGYDAVNKWKDDKGAKGANKEKPKKPVLVIRDHPARTANGVFITDMVNAVEEVDGEPMNLHMLTFDSELDNATLMQKGGQWIDKTAMELKAFHNEEDGQAYGNLDSISGKFYVYWNFVYTGTPLSLDRKVTEQNFGTGLATRLAVIPMPEREFQLAAYGSRRKVDHAADELLKTWAFRLDGVRGELPIEPLVRATYDWQSAEMEIAGFDDDKALDMLLMRVPYYGIGIAAPYVLMRHWDEWQETKTLALDEHDVRLCRLAMDIQYACQQHFFYAYAQAYFENMERDRKVKGRTRRSKYDDCYKQLPEEFTVDDFKVIYGMEECSALRMQIFRLEKDGKIETLDRGKYKKLVKRLM
jgi:hypothetical protein